MLPNDACRRLVPVPPVKHLPLLLPINDVPVVPKRAGDGPVAYQPGNDVAVCVLEVSGNEANPEGVGREDVTILHGLLGPPNLFINVGYPGLSRA